jgi:hypothetical protein
VQSGISLLRCGMQRRVSWTAIWWLECLCGPLCFIIIIHRRCILGLFSGRLVDRPFSSPTWGFSMWGQTWIPNLPNICNHVRYSQKYVLTICVKPKLFPMFWELGLFPTQLGLLQKAMFTVCSGPTE